MSHAATDDSRPKRAFVFPGVGVRPCGKEGAFLERHQAMMAPVLDEASDFAGVDLRRALKDEPDLTELQGQLFTYAFDVAVARAYQSLGVAPSLAAGHSMGIYGVLASAGAIAFADGLRVVERAFHCVEHATTSDGAGMAVVVGLPGEEIEALIAAQPADGTVLRVNANNDTTFVLAGLVEDLVVMVDEALARDALKARLLPVGAAYHHPGLLPGASEAFGGFLRILDWSPARWPIVSSIDQSLLVEPAALLDLTARNLTSPIDWAAVVRRLVAEGVEQILECGPGISLAQNGRLIEGCPRVVTVKNAAKRLEA